MAFSIVLTRRIPDAGLQLLTKQRGFKIWMWDKPTPIPRRVLLQRAQGAHAIISLLTDKVDEEVLRAAGPQLRIVANYAVGYDNIDVDSCNHNHVIVTNTPNVLNTAVAEHTIALMMSIGRRIVESDAFTRAKKFKTWQPDLLLGTEFSGKTFGLVGAGRIGSMVARIAHHGLGMQILYHNPHVNEELEKEYAAKRVTKTQLLTKSDVVSLHVPLTPETRHLIGAADLAKMKNSAILINTARGPVVDEHALISALSRGVIAGAALDVFECEPAIACSILDTYAVRKLKNIILTPHTASATFEARNAMAVTAAKNVIAVLGGKAPITPVDNGRR